MKDYEAINELIHQARIERSVYLAGLISDAIAATWNGIKSSADVLLSVARARPSRNVFTFDA